MSFRRFRLEHVDQDGVADVERRGGLGVAAVELAVADHALALGPDVDEDLVAIDPNDRSLDDVAMLEAADVRILLGEQLGHRRRLRPGRPSRLGRRRLGDLPGEVVGHGGGLDGLLGELHGGGLDDQRLNGELPGSLVGRKRLGGQLLGGVLHHDGLGDELLGDGLGRKRLGRQLLRGVFIAGGLRDRGLLGELLGGHLGLHRLCDELLGDDVRDDRVLGELLGDHLGLDRFHGQPFRDGVCHDRLFRELHGGFDRRAFLDHRDRRIGRRRCLRCLGRRILRGGLRGGRLLLLFRQGSLLLVWIPPEKRGRRPSLARAVVGFQVRGPCAVRAVRPSGGVGRVGSSACRPAGAARV